MMYLCMMVLMLILGVPSYAAHTSDNAAKNGKLQARVPLNKSDREQIPSDEWELSETELENFKKNNLDDYIALLEAVRKAKNNPVIVEDGSLKKQLEQYDTAFKYEISNEELKELHKKYEEISLAKKKKHKKKNQLSYAWKLRLQVAIAREDHADDEFSNPGKTKACGAAKDSAAKK